MCLKLRYDCESIIYICSFKSLPLDDSPSQTAASLSHLRGLFEKNNIEFHMFIKFTKCTDTMNLVVEELIDSAWKREKVLRNVTFPIIWMRMKITFYGKKNMEDCFILFLIFPFKPYSKYIYV